MHEQYVEINASQTNQCQSRSCPLMVGAKIAGGCELIIKSGMNRMRITWVYTMRDS